MHELIEQRHRECGIAVPELQIVPFAINLISRRSGRASGRKFPIVILTGRDNWRDEVQGLAAGADDYVCKPFAFEEVEARISALMLRMNGWLTPALVRGPYVP